MALRRTLTSISMLLAACALAGTATAQAVQKESPATAFTGKLTAVDASAKTIHASGANGEAGVFKIDDKATTIMSGSQKVGISALHEGEWVAIDADDRNGEKVATYIEVVEDPMAVSAPGKALPTTAGAAVEVGTDTIAPALVQIGAGQSVTFRNSGSSGVRTVVATDGAFSSPPLEAGQTWSHSFDVPGVYPIQIKEHPATGASIVVE